MVYSQNILGMKPDGISHPLAESDHPESITPPRRSQSPSTAPRGVARGDWLVHLGLVRVGLGFFKGWCDFRVYLGLTT